MVKLWLIGLITIIALYFGTGGFIMLQHEQLHKESRIKDRKEVDYQGVILRNKDTMISVKQQDLIMCIYPYATKIPSTLSFFLTAISFGVIGSVGKVINDSIQKEKILKEVKNLLLVPIQGAMIGIIVLGISYTVPIVLTNDDVMLKPITIVFLSLFGGIFYMNFYSWITSVIDRTLFKKNE